MHPRPHRASKPFPVNTNDSLFWRLPLWLDVHSQAVFWGHVFLVMASVMALGTAVAWGERHPKRVALTFAAVAMLISLVVLRFRFNPPLLVDPSAGVRTRKGYELQTTPYTCVPAAGASIAMQLGVTTTEAELAVLMGTTGQGISPGHVILGMRAVGVHGAKAPKGLATELAAPAMLFVDHPATGPESPAVALPSSASNDMHIVDPLQGSRHFAAEALRQIWHGKAITFRIAEQSAAPAPRAPQARHPDTVGCHSGTQGK